MDQFLLILELSYFGNTVYDYLVGVGILLFFLIFFKVLKHRVFKALEKWAHKTKTDLDDEIIKNVESIPSSLYFFVALYIGMQFIVIHPIVTKAVWIIMVILAIYWATKVASELIEYSLRKFAKKDKKETAKNTTYFALAMIAKIILWSTGLLLVLSNLGVNISALIASLGIGGIAIALAMQNILGDIFSSFSLYMDKPFEVGDFIIIGEHEGYVKKIGLKTTRVEALQGEEIVISNNELTSSRVRNFKKMQKRRIVFGIGVTYDTTPAKLNKIPKMAKEIINKVKNCDFDRAHFKSFGDFSLNYELVYYIKSGAYKDYLDAQHKINVEIMRAFEKEGIEMAFPTQTIHLQKAEVQG
ncbi:MAG: mechanosensitive ion channel family protein [Candidatus Peregrinibacteria bacterium]|nr:mechanosensitive ion channel family protein [Candidatus Peregrinibacteria bacterium]